MLNQGNKVAQLAKIDIHSGNRRVIKTEGIGRLAGLLVQKK
ncbi:hypothetical protein KCO_00225 [Pectobacterium brasiliense ICMP 19477]|nr:hypothetical protein KCO_00225 [Pectobacterium brasiliense ICMP 19477]